MIFGHFLLSVNEANAFIVGCPETREALLVDVAEWEPQLEQFLEMHRLKLTTVFITHDHYDHTGGLDTLMKRFPVKAYSGSGRAGGRAVARIGHGETIRFGHITGQVVSTPGHTPEGISLILPGMAFTGDALFSGSVGGTASRADFNQQIEAIRQHLFTLPDTYELHTGHGPSSTVAVERRHNPFFAGG